MKKREAFFLFPFCSTQLVMLGQGPHDSVQTMGLPENTRNATQASVVRMHNTGDHNELM